MNFAGCYESSSHRPNGIEGLRSGRKDFAGATRLLPAASLSVCFLLACAQWVSGIARAETATPSHDPEEVPSGEVLEAPERPRNWSVQAGVAFITESNIEEIVTGVGQRAHGDPGGQLYNIMVNWTAYRFEIPFRDRLLKPHLEPYVNFTLVDEHGRSPFPDYNAGLGFRWVDFPWNKWVDTTFFMGVGFSYSTHVFRIDRIRHPGDDRSHLKFDWPLQITLASPRAPRHQLVLFNDHQSGGHFFDQGGVNSLGIGYRLEF